MAKAWGAAEEDQARKEAAADLNGIEQVTWHEDALMGGAGVVRQLWIKGLRPAVSYAVKKLIEVGKDAVQAGSQAFVVFKLLKP